MARDVVVTGNTAYVADQVDGLQVIDISDPANPALLGSFNTSGFALGIAVAGNLVYIADSSSGLQIIDVSDPTTPSLVGTYDTPGFAAAVVVACV